MRDRLRCGARHSGDGRTTRCTIHSTLLVASARPKSSITRVLHHIWFLTSRSGRSCGPRRGCRTFCTNVQARMHQNALQRLRIDAQLHSPARNAHVALGAAACRALQRAHGLRSVQHSDLVQCVHRAAPRRGPRDVPPRVIVRARRVARSRGCAGAQRSRLLSAPVNQQGQHAAPRRTTGPPAARRGAS